jgi:hypothetical protein
MIEYFVIGAVYAPVDDFVLWFWSAIGAPTAFAMSPRRASTDSVQSLRPTFAAIPLSDFKEEA